MTERRYELAQANIARMRAPLEDPIMADFVDQLDRVNQCAENSTGFIWRLQTEEGDATAIRVFDDERLLFNMSVWASVEALHAYTYRSLHVGPLRDRKRWFERFDRPHIVLWWVPAGRRPMVEEAEERFSHLWTHGPTEFGFTFKTTFPPPERTLGADRPQLRG